MTTPTDTTEPAPTTTIDGLVDDAVDRPDYLPADRECAFIRPGTGECVPFTVELPAGGDGFGFLATTTTTIETTTTTATVPAPAPVDTLPATGAVVDASIVVGALLLGLGAICRRAVAR